jgi:hypothetical protein
VMVAIIAVMWHRSVVRPAAWAGFAVSLGGVGLIAAGGGGGANLAGDGMVLTSVLLSAVFTVGQTRLLRGRDPIAVTAVQFLGAALVTAPFSALTESLPSAPAHAASLLAVVALIAGGTLVPFTLFAFGQSRLPAEVAGAFLNIEPLVGAVAGVVVFGNPAGPAQLSGGAAILGGIALSSVRRRGRRTASPGITAPAVAEHAVAEHAVIAAVPVPAALAAAASPAAVRAGSGRRVAGHRVAGHGVAEHVMAEAGAPLARSAGAHPVAARHPAVRLRPGRGHRAGQPPRVGRRRPRGQLRPEGRREADRPRPGDVRRRVLRPAGRV